MSGLLGQTILWRSVKSFSKISDAPYMFPIELMVQERENATLFLIIN